MIADHTPTWHQQSLLHRVNDETMTISMIGSHSISVHIVDRMVLVTTHPSWSYCKKKVIKNWYIIVRQIKKNTVNSHECISQYSFLCGEKQAWARACLWHVALLCIPLSYAVCHEYACLRHLIKLCIEHGRELEKKQSHFCFMTFYLSSFSHRSSRYVSRCLNIGWSDAILHLILIFYIYFKSYNGLTMHPKIFAIKCISSTQQHPKKSDNGKAEKGG